MAPDNTELGPPVWLWGRSLWGLSTFETPEDGTDGWAVSYLGPGSQPGQWSRASELGVPERHGAELPTQAPPPLPKIPRPSVTCLLPAIRVQATNRWHLRGLQLCEGCLPGQVRHRPENADQRSTPHGPPAPGLLPSSLGRRCPSCLTWPHHPPASSPPAQPSPRPDSDACGGRRDLEGRWELTDSRLFLEVCGGGPHRPGDRAYTSLVWTRGAHCPLPWQHCPTCRWGVGDARGHCRLSVQDTPAGLGPGRQSRLSLKGRGSGAANPR